MEKILPINSQKQENTGRKGFPAVYSHTAMLRNSAAV